MTSIIWNDSHSVGNAQIDADHGIVITLLNQLHDAVDTGQAREVVGSIINVLAEYVEHHFHREEAILAHAGFPELEEHARVHRTLEERLYAIRNQWLAGQRDALDEDGLAGIKNWLTEHIFVTDKSYYPWVRANRAL